MKLRTSEAIAILEALNKLDGCKFAKDSGKLLYNIGRNIRLLSVVRDDLTIAQKRLLEQLSDGKGSLAEGTPAAWRFRKANDEIMCAETEVGLHRISFTALLVDENHIDGSTLAKLDPILDDLPTE